MPLEDLLCNLHTYLLALFGLVVLALFLLDTAWGLTQIARAVLVPYFLPHEDVCLSKRYGCWALVTGSTDGIGRSYSKELAKRGMNIVLVSRNLDKLNATASEIESEFNVKTKVISSDFSAGQKAIDVIRRELQDLEIGILVNNVGKQYSYPMDVGEVDEQELWDIINVNVGATTMMTRLLINDMKKRGRGAVVNVSSGSELQPLPLMAVYAATKVYIKSFTSALRYEYSKYGLTVQHLSPMFVNTKMNHFSDRISRSSLFVPDADTYAKYAVSLLGKVDTTTGYWTHGIQYFFASIPPVWARMYIGGFLNKMFVQDYNRKVLKVE